MSDDPAARRPLDETPPPSPSSSRGGVGRRPASGAGGVASAPGAEGPWSDRAVDERLGRLLQMGVLLAGAVVLFGAVLYLWRHGHEIADYAVFRGEPEELRTVSGIVHGTRAGRARGLIQLGLLLLVATPIARVAFAGYAFARQRDWLYAGIALFVLLFLFVSLRGGFF